MDGIPDKLNSANLRLSPTISLSPWKTEMRIPLCPSFCVVYCRPAFDGIFELRGIITSMSPPIVSMPSDSGVTSNKSIDVLFPASMSACTAAPSATTSSGFNESNTSLPKNFLTLSLTNGTRVDPPTITIASIWLAVSCASRSAFLHASMVRCTSGVISSLNSSRLIRTSSPLIVPSKTSWSLKCLFAFSAVSLISCASDLSGELPSPNARFPVPASSCQYLTSILSISSPPR